MLFPTMLNSFINPNVTPASEGQRQKVEIMYGLTESTDPLETDNRQPRARLANEQRINWIPALAALDCWHWRAHPFTAGTVTEALPDWTHTKVQEEPREQPWALSAAAPLLRFWPTPLPREASWQAQLHTKHRKGSSPSWIPDNAAMLITAELLQAFTSAQIF